MADAPESTSQGAQPHAASTLIDPRLFAPFYGLEQEDGIDLGAYWDIVKKRWKSIASVMFSAAIISAGISLLMPNIYEAQVLLAPVNQGTSNSPRSGLSSALGDFGGLTSVSGISVGTDSSALQNLAVLKSRTFLWGFIKENKLMPILFAKAWDASKKTWKKSDPKKQPSLWDAYRKFTRMLTVATHKKSGLVTVSVNWTDPDQAANWANELVVRLNDYMRQRAIARSEASLKYLNEALQKTSIADVRQALFTLIADEQKKAMIANTQKEYAFRVLDPAVSPDVKDKPHRSLIVILSTFVAGLLAVIFVCSKEADKKRSLAEAGAA